jgi:hypothetical protein
MTDATSSQWLLIREGTLIWTFQATCRVVGFQLEASGAACNAEMLSLRHGHTELLQQPAPLWCASHLALALDFGIFEPGVELRLTLGPCEGVGQLRPAIRSPSPWP